MASVNLIDFGPFYLKTGEEGEYFVDLEAGSSYESRPFSWNVSAFPEHRVAITPAHDQCVEVFHLQTLRKGVESKPDINRVQLKWKAKNVGDHVVFGHFEGTLVQ